ATVTLLKKMWALFETPERIAFALNRGRYTKAVASMEFHGIPIDVELLTHLRANWERLQELLIARIDEQYGVYEGRTFKLWRFAEYLGRNDSAWPTLPSGRLALDDDTFSDQCKSRPQLRPLKDLRQALGQLRLS